MKTYNIGDLWECRACERRISVDIFGATCRGAGHFSYLSLEHLQGYNANKNALSKESEHIEIPKEGIQSKMFKL